MKIVIQRVQRASVTINGRLHSSIQKGMLILVGIQVTDRLPSSLTQRTEFNRSKHYGTERTARPGRHLD